MYEKNNNFDTLNYKSGQHEKSNHKGSQTWHPAAATWVMDQAQDFGL